MDYFGDRHIQQGLVMTKKSSRTNEFCIKNIEIYKRIFMVIKGLAFWKWIKKEIQIENDVVVLIPENDEEIYRYAGMYIDDLLIQGRKDKVVFLVRDDAYADLLMRYSINVKKIRRINSDSMNNLLMLYQLYQFDSNFYVASFNHPFGRNSEKIISDFSNERAELFATCIYRIIPQTKILKKSLQDG